MDIVVILFQASQVHAMGYTVTGSGAADISTSFDDFRNKSLPWSQKASVSGFGDLRTLEAHSLSGSSITCSISIDGKVEDRQTGTGNCFCSTTL